MSRLYSSLLLLLFSFLSLILFIYHLNFTNYNLDLVQIMLPYYVLNIMSFILGLVNSFKHRYRSSQGFLFPLFLLLLSFSYLADLAQIIEFSPLIISEYYLVQGSRYLKVLIAVILLLSSVNNLKDIPKIELVILPIGIIVYYFISTIPVFTTVDYVDFLIIIILITSIIVYFMAIICHNLPFYYLRFLSVLFYSAGYYICLMHTGFVFTIAVAILYFIAGIFVLSTKNID